MMNDRFFTLPAARQDAIINAGFKVFSTSDYKHASMSAIADAGGISKSLLFHYFGNKEGLYFYLWNFAAETTAQSVREYGIQETADPFEILTRTTRAKCSVMKDHPYMSAFATRAYYETEPHIKQRIQDDIDRYTRDGEALFAKQQCTEYLADGAMPEHLFQDFLMLSDGYMLQKYRSNEIDAATIENEMIDIISRWKQFFGRKDTQQ